MNILLIQPFSRKTVANILPDYVVEEAGTFPPLGLMYVASAVKKLADVKVEILDANISKLSLEDIKKETAKRQPSIVGLSATTFTLKDIVDTAKAVKEVNPNIHICIGGPHTSIYPDETIDLPYVDSVVIGEGETAFSELVKRLSKNEDLSGIKGLVYKNKAKHKINNGPAEFCSDVDSLAVPARHLIDPTAYRSIIGEKYPFTTIISSRGCTFDCLYCYHAFGRKFRGHSAGYMINEIKECLKLGIREFWYFDDNFTINRKRALDFCTALKNENIDIVWHIRTRIDLVDAELLEHLKQAGCKRIFIGIESGVEKTLKTLRKQIHTEQALSNFKMVKSFGFETYLDFMIGSPGETREEIMQTIAFAIKLDPDYVQFAITTPYPATDLYTQGLDKGIIENDFWKEFAGDPSGELKLELYNEYLSLEELKVLLNTAYRKFYLRPYYILKRLMDIKSCTDLMHKAKAAVNMLLSVGKK